MAATDRIRQGEDHWRAKVRDRAGSNPEAHTALLAQFDAMLRVFRACDHDAERMTVEPGHAACTKCKWVYWEAATSWYPTGYGR